GRRARLPGRRGGRIVGGRALATRIAIAGARGLRSGSLVGESRLLRGDRRGELVIGRPGREAQAERLGSSAELLLRGRRDDRWRRGLRSGSLVGEVSARKVVRARDRGILEQDLRGRGVDVEGDAALDAATSSRPVVEREVAAALVHELRHRGPPYTSP